ncbi:MAG: signal peptide peptidase SppA [Haloferacaceae archaeon]
MSDDPATDDAPGSDESSDGSGPDAGDASEESRAEEPSPSTAPPVDAAAPGSGDRFGRVLVVVAGTLLVAVVGWMLFVALPATLADLFGTVLALAVALLGLRGATRLAAARFPDYNVAEVAVEGPITRDGGRSGPFGRVVGTSADDVVEQIEAADDDDAVDALLLKLNTPGGEIVPSDDVRAAAAAFEGPTIAYATDVCASGGYWIASSCDELWAREASLVGSIGVIGSRPNAAELADRVGVSYERFAAGQYKDAGNPLKEPTEDDRAYLQGLIDEFYEDFVERVAEGRGLDPDEVRDTEARVYLGREAAELGLVDALGDRDDVEARASEILGVETSVTEFEPERGLAERLRGGAATVAYALGAGVADAVTGEGDASDEFDLRL